METEDRIMVYDGNCNVCRTAIHTLARWKWIDATKAKDFYELPAEKQSQIELEQFKSEMASIDINGGRTYYGVEAVFNAMGYRFPFLKKAEEKKSFVPLHTILLPHYSLEPLYNNEPGKYRQMRL